MLTARPPAGNRLVALRRARVGVRCTSQVRPVGGRRGRPRGGRGDRGRMDLLSRARKNAHLPTRERSGERAEAPPLRGRGVPTHLAAVEV